MRAPFPDAPLADARPADPAPVITASGLGLTYEAAAGRVTALTGVDLEVAEGELVAFIGPSGCGKTTFLRLVADLERPSEGRLAVFGVSPAEARARRLYAYVFQQAGLFPWRTIEGNVTLPLLIQGLPRAVRRERAARYLELVGLSGFARHRPWQLSGGMQQRASIARALALEPRLLLMDEPFGALDEIVRDRLNEELLALWRATAKTILFVTHSIPEAVFLASRIVVMSPRPGRIAQVLTSHLPPDRGLEVRETAPFLELARTVRRHLREGHGLDALD